MSLDRSDSAFLTGLDLNLSIQALRGNHTWPIEASSENSTIIGCRVVG